MTDITEHYLARSSITKTFWEQNVSLLEKSRFRAKLEFKPGILAAASVFAGGPGSAAFDENFVKDILEPNIIALSIPQFSLDVKRIMTLGRVRYSVKSNEYQDIRIIFMETTDLKIKYFFEKYMRCFFSQSTLQRMYYPDDAAFTLTVENIDENGESSNIKETYEGCIPSFINDFNYDVQDDASAVSTTEIIVVFKKQEITKDDKKEGKK